MSIQKTVDNNSGGVNLFSISTILLMLLYLLPQVMLFISNDVLAIIATLYYALFVSKYVPPQILLKTLLIAIPFLLLYWINGFSGNFKLGFVLPFMTFLTFLIPCFAFIATVKRNNIAEQKVILIATGVCLLYIAIASLRALSENPMIMREMAGRIEEDPLIRPARMRGVGGFGTAYAMGALFIAFWGIRKYVKKSLIHPILFYVILIGSAWLVVESQYATLLFISLLGVAIYYYIEAKTIIQKIIIVIVTIVLLVLSKSLIQLGMSISGLEVLRFKFELIYDGIWGGSGVENISGDRSQLQLNAWDLFLRSPIIGMPGFSSMEAYNRSHSTVFGVLISSGVVGFISYISLYISALRRSIKTCLSNRAKELYMPVVLFYLAFAFLNPIDYVFDCPWVIFYVVPLLLVLVVNDQTDVAKSFA